MAVLNVDKIKAQLPGSFPCMMKIFDNRFNLRVGEKWIIAWQPQSAVQYRMVIKDARLGPVAPVWPAESPGMSQLQANEESVLRTRCPQMLFNQHPAQT